MRTEVQVVRILPGYHFLIYQPARPAILSTFSRDLGDAENTSIEISCSLWVIFLQINDVFDLPDDYERRIPGDLCCK